jgi:predicted RNase H-like nuclease (RuvC/YqgF family)
MKNDIELLNYLIAKETKSIEAMCHLNKEDELTIHRLHNRLKALEKDIEEHKQLIKEYRSQLRKMPKSTHTNTKLKPARKSHLNTELSIAQIKLLGRLEKQV